MAKDERLWMRFPIDMHRDMKVTRLPVEVRWTFFEMNGEARLERNDGVFSHEDAEFRWPVEHLTALVASHPTEPLVVKTPDAYVLRRYAKHQFTEADREALADKRAEAGKAGAAKRWAGKDMASDGKPMASAKQTMATPMANDGKAWQAVAEIETDKEIDKEVTSNEVTNTTSEAATATPRPDVEHLLDILDDEIRRNGGRTPKRNKANRDAMRLMLDRDELTPEQIEAAIRWAHASDFWRANILSASKLREKYDTLRLQSMRVTEARSTGHERAYARQAENLSVVARMQALDAQEQQKGITA